MKHFNYSSEFTKNTIKFNIIDHRIHEIEPFFEEVKFLY
jgi:hypothetical protein